MITIRLNGVDVQVREGSTILEACRLYGVPIPTLCYNEGLKPYGACRLCIVEIGEGENTRFVSSCTYPVDAGLIIKTHSKRVIQTRKLLIELLVALCPSSKTIQDLASKHGVSKIRFKPKYVNCVLCGLCVRVCNEQMDARAIGFSNRGKYRKVTTPFNIKSEVCRTCGGCIYICPACQLRCQGTEIQTTLCNACLNISYPCVDVKDKALCYLDPCASCLLEEKERQKEKKK
ncbi:MAG: 2Fe-2S iron-sulfur cluster-binding protein [Candidatus Hydrogenedentota bacterium]